MDFNQFCRKHPLIYLLALIFCGPPLILLVAITVFIKEFWEALKYTYTETIHITKDGIKTGKRQWERIFEKI